MNLSKTKIFLLACIFFIFGIAVASFLPIKWLQYDLWFFGIMISLTIFLFLSSKMGKRLPIFIFCLFFILGIWRYSFALPLNTPDKIWFYNNQAIEFVGVINKEPDVRMYNTKLTVRVESVKTLHATSLPVRGNVLVTTRLYPEHNYGDRLQIKCELQQPEPFGEFAYDQYLARHDIYSICYYPRILIVETRHGASLRQVAYATILKFKDKLKEVINYGLLEPEASVLQAMLLGNRRGLPAELLNNFSQAGVSHIIAISGMHIALLSVIVMQILFMIGLSRRWAFGLTTTFLIIYVIIIGLPASAVRASIMTFLILLAMQLGRLGNVINGLVFTASLLLLFNPRLLRDDIGFQLSFLAVLSIVYIFPIIDKYFDKIKIPPPHWAGQAKLKGVRDIITVTLAAQVLTLPIIALNFHQVSLVAPLVNLLVVPLLPVIMGGGLLALILSLIIPGLAWLFFTPVYLILKYLLWIASTSIHLPLAYIEVDYVWLGWIILFYVVVSYVIIKKNKT